MKKIFILLLFLSCLPSTAFSQITGTWTTYLAYHTTTNVAEGKVCVYGVADNSLYSYGKEDNSVRFYSKKEGLNDSKIDLIAYNPETEALLIVYSNQNIDLLQDNGDITNLPFLKDNSTINDKKINHIYFNKEYAYLSANFGIVVVNMRKGDITDTYKLNKSVYSSCINGNRIYASTPTGLLSAALNDNLLDGNNWHPYFLTSDEVRSEEIRTVALFQGKLIFFAPHIGIFYQQDDEKTETLIKGGAFEKMTVQNDILIAYHRYQVHLWYSFNEHYAFDSETTADISAFNTTHTFWLASEEKGIIGLKQNSSKSFDIIKSDLLAEGENPKRNYATFMTVQGNKLYVAGGGRWANRFDRPGTVMIYDGDKWTNIDENVVKNESGIRFSDVTSIAADPKDDTHYFASTWGEGVFEFKDNKFINRYHKENSSLESALSTDYVRVEGLCFDKQGNLWMTNSADNGGANVMKADGTWHNLSYLGLKGHSIVDKILITEKGYKWVNILRDKTGNYGGIFAFDDKGTLDDTSDDVTMSILPFHDAKGNDLSLGRICCMAEDKKGEIWLGSSKGPVICPVPGRSVSVNKNPYFTRIIRTSEDGTMGYFLDGEQINAIAIDGGNRKWIGTETSGLYLINSDGSETISHFTTSNSPILSDKIISLAINNITGEVFIGTGDGAAFIGSDTGIISYMGGASEGKENYSNVQVYPNPVRPEYQDQVTITGLMANSNVKITDINGQLIYQAKSLGGQLSWNCHNRSGNRVATGIYLVIAATPDAGESVVAKIMVIK